MVAYIRLIFIPVHQTVEYDYVLVRSIFELPVALSALVLLSILFVAVKISKKYRLMAFGIFWFFITLLPESSFWPNQDLIFEHRLYLPLMGFCIFLTSGVFYFVRGNGGSLAIRILFLFVLVYSFLAYQRNKVWHDELSLWDDAVRQSPKDARAYLNRGAAYQSKGDLDHAMEDYNMVIGLGPITAVTLSNRGSIFRLKGDFEHALANFNLAIKINPSYAGTYVNRGFLYKIEGKLDLALADINKAVVMIPNDADAHFLRGRILEQQGKLQEARTEYQRGEILRKAQ
jgi:tetratricopeptide (TPR) repeat protein